MSVDPKDVVPGTTLYRVVGKGGRPQDQNGDFVHHEDPIMLHSPIPIEVSHIDEDWMGRGPHVAVGSRDACTLHDPAFLFASLEEAEAECRKRDANPGGPVIFVFAQGDEPWVEGIAITTEGEILAGHCSSSASWARRDMGADGFCDWKHDEYWARYPEGWSVEWVEDPTTHDGLQEAIRRNKAMAVEQEA